MTNFIRTNIIAFLVLIVSNQLSQAQLVTIETELDRNKIELGRWVELRYIVIKGTDDIVKLPVINDTLIDGIEVVSDIEIDSVKLDDGKEKLIQKFKITSFDLGLQYIPPQPLHLLRNMVLTLLYLKTIIWK